MNKSIALCERDDSLLLITDVQPELTAVMPVKVLARLQRNISLLLKVCALLDIPVLSSGLEGAGDMAPELAQLLPAGAQHYRKTGFSCLTAPGFREDMEHRGRRQVILTGMESHISVLQTAVQLSENGFHAFIVTDAVCSRQRENYETGLQRLRQQPGVVLSDAESVVHEWLRDTHHPRFAAIQALLR